MTTASNHDSSTEHSMEICASNPEWRHVKSWQVWDAYLVDGEESPLPRASEGIVGDEVLEPPTASTLRVPGMPPDVRAR